jgi:hypothetical protein
MLKNNRMNINSTSEKSPLKRIKTHGCTDFVVEQKWKKSHHPVYNTFF